MTETKRDRRIHKVFVTQNTESHVRRDRCVAVRDRQSGRFVPRHLALFRKIAGAIGFMEDGSFRAERQLPEPGESLVFEGTGAITSAVIAVERPPRTVAVRYPILGGI